MIYFDTETIGFHGPTVLIQYAIDDGEIILHSVFTEPIEETLELIEKFCNDSVIGFNLAFDWFHICQTYTTLQLLGAKIGFDKYPIDYIDDYAELEDKARFGPCCKPVSALDLMLHARKGPYQSTMDRSDIKIKKVPTKLAYLLAGELSKRIPLKDVYFARYKDKSQRWQVHDIVDDFGKIVEDFKTIVLKFAPSVALKALAQDALGFDVIQYSDIDVGPKPIEQGWSPWATAPYIPDDMNQPVYPSRENWHGKWPQYARIYISHWAYNKLARVYASDDVQYTRMLHKYFSALERGHNHLVAQDYAKSKVELNIPLLPCGDDNSILACMVASVRWRGFAIDLESLKKLREKAVAKVKAFSGNFNAPGVCRHYITEVMDEMELSALRDNQGKISTKGIFLEHISRWTKNEVCNDCMGMGCQKCKQGLIESKEPHPAAKRAKEILQARRAKKEIELYDKLILAGRFHASFKVIGALSNRMAGADGLNPQGINRAKVVRRCFPLADGNLVLCGGDFSGFEICLMDAAYADPRMHEELLSGLKIHAIWGSRYFFPDKTYEEVKSTAGLPNEEDLYDRSKKGVFAVCYFGEGHTLITRVGIAEENAHVAYEKILKDYPEFAKKRRDVINMFQSMRQPNGIGTKVEWHEPADCIESMFDWKRYFTLENRICKALFDLASDPPKEWTELKIKVVRRSDRGEQTVSGAVRSALFAAAFAIQGSNMRAAGNHRIQSSGATLTKRLQVELWNLQPSGISAWQIQPMQVHDEIMTPMIESLIPHADEVRERFIKQYRVAVPLLEIEWSNRIPNWASK